MIAPALGLGHGTQRLRRVAEQNEPLHPVGEAIGVGAGHPDHDPGVVHRRSAIDRDEVPVGIEVVLDELAARDRTGGIATLGREHLDQLGRVHRAAAAGLHDPPRALVQRLQRPRRGLVDLDDDAAAGGREEAQLAVADLRRRAGRACGRG